MKIGQKIAVSTLFVSILISVIGYLGVSSSKIVGEIFDSVESEAVPSLTILLEIIAATRQSSIKAMEFSMRGDEKDKLKSKEALEKIYAGLKIIEKIEIHIVSDNKVELRNKIVNFAKVIENYLALSAGPTLKEIILDEKSLLSARKKLIKEAKRLIEEERSLSLELTSIISEARRVAIKSVEFSLRGNGQDYHKTHEAFHSLNSLLDEYLRKSDSNSANQLISELVGEYIAVSKRYIEKMSKKHAPALEIFKTEKEVHRVRRELIHFLYPLIEQEREELRLASVKTHGSVEATQNVILLSVFVVAGITLAIGFVIARSISRPISQLNNVALEVAKGNLDETLNIHSKDEIGSLAKSFMHMTSELRENRDNLDGLVKTRTLELEASNKELESFSYSVAHDLRTPLRAITSFSQILKEDAEHKLDDDEKESLSRIVAAGKKMSNLIESILDLAKISRQNISLEKINLSEVVEEIIDQMFNPSNGNNVQWKIKDGITACGDEHLLSVALQNLIDNAFKYSSKVDSPAIEFGIESKEGETVYFVKDNGAGFDMKFSDKLFGNFQRLHGQEYEGIGIGLATVERIIHRHGGKIWAESSVGGGATFYFTLNT